MRKCKEQKEDASIVGIYKARHKERTSNVVYATDGRSRKHILKNNKIYK